MATNTYVALQTVTASSASTVSFTSIPSTYTDLRIVAVGISSTTGSSVNNWRMTFNGDSTSGLYSNTALYGNGSTASSNRDSNGNFIYLGLVGQASNTAQPVSTFDIMNYSNNTTNKTVLSRGSSASDSTYASVGLWRNTAVINRVDLFMSGATVTGTFTIYGIANADNFTKATGGIISEDSTYTYHVFGSSGTFTPKQALTADILVVAGGGGSGSSRGAGGGAGGLLGFTSQSLTATGYTVTVGAGGAGGASGSGNRGTNGGDSQFGALTLVKGGGGGAGAAQSTGSNGGSGGGTIATGGYGVATSGQGYNGGNGGSYLSGSGGGGAGAVGGDATGDTAPGSGGVGLSTYSSWGLVTSTGHNVNGTVYYAGGGGGGKNGVGGTTSTGGDGGGGAGTNTADGLGGAGLAYTGGGGGAGTNTTIGVAGSAGGSGVVIIRYPK